jgi:hypothetical protein
VGFRVRSQLQACRLDETQHYRTHKILCIVALTLIDMHEAKRKAGYWTYLATMHSLSVTYTLISTYHVR